MIYASTDLHWEAPPAGPADPSHIGSRVLLEGMWKRLGTSIAWSVAVHPYGEPNADPGLGNYGFANMQSLVLAFQEAHLARLNIPAASYRAYPQDYLIASEQAPFDVGNPDQDYRAVKICQEDAAALTLPTLVGILNYHLYYAADVYGILPESVQPDLGNLLSVPTGQAYAATNPKVWGKASDHYCCLNAGLGCGSVAAADVGKIVGNIDGLQPINGVNYLNGWACALGVHAPVRSDVYVGGAAGVGTLIDHPFYADQPSEPAVSQACGLGNVPGSHRFHIPIDADSAARYAGKSLYVHGISPNLRPNVAISQSGVYKISGKFAFENATSNDVLWDPANAIDADPRTCYSSAYYPNATNGRGSSLAAWLEARANGAYAVNEIDLVARQDEHGLPMAFPSRYQIYLTNADNSAWVSMGEFTNAPGADGMARVILPATAMTWGVQIVPSALTVDNNDRADLAGHYFQLCGLTLR